MFWPSWVLFFQRPSLQLCWILATFGASSIQRNFKSRVSMDIPQEIDGYIKESIQYSLGLPIPARTLELKLQASLEAQNQLRDRCLHLRSKLKEKDEIIERTRVCSFFFLSCCSLSFPLRVSTQRKIKFLYLFKSLLVKH